MIQAFEQQFLSLPSDLPKLFINGREDTLSKEADVDKILKDVAPPMEKRYVEGANHMFEGKEEEVAEQAVAFVVEQKS